MSMSQHLESRLEQSPVFTPRLQQAVRMLQMSNVELAAFLEGQLEQNPFLTGDSAAADAFGLAQAAAQNDNLSADKPTQPALALAEVGVSFDWTANGRPARHALVDDGFASGAANAPTLREHLNDQLRILALPDHKRAIAEVLIDGLDEAGYLRVTCAEAAAQLGCPPDLVEWVLGQLQQMEPAGLFARDVRECLRLQLADRNRLDPAMCILLDHLPLVARREYAALRRVCGVDESDLRDMLAEIRNLTPRPGAGFGASATEFAVPDVFVRPDGYGGWRIDINTETMPHARVDERYCAALTAASLGEADKEFIAANLGAAKWLVGCLDQRSRTILKVATEIVRLQDAFLALGVEHLRPLNLKTVADAIGVHESTVSRATANKFIDTPRGVFEMKFFFTSAIGAVDEAAAHSSESVRHKIRQIIDSEAGRGAGFVYSDDQIVDSLRRSGIDIARRTVAKYRDAMRIPSSVERRRHLKAA